MQNPYPPFHLLRLHVPKGDLLLSTLLLAGAPPDDAFKETFGVREGEKTRGELSTARNLVALGAMGATINSGKNSVSSMGCKKWKDSEVRGTWSEGSPPPPSSLLGCRDWTARDLLNRAGTMCSVDVMR